MHEQYKKFQCIACDFAFWKIMGGRQIEPAEAETLLSERSVGPLDGFRSRIGRPFSAKLKLNDANEVEFDFGPRVDDDDGVPPDFSAQTPLGPCPKCGNRVFETPNAYVCERAVGEGRTCDFRSGRTILQRSIEPRADGEAARNRQDRPAAVRLGAHASAVLRVSRQADGRQGRLRVRGEGAGARGRAAVRSAPLRVLGKHPRDRQPVELHAGRYGPYVKHGATNATLPDRDAVDSLSLEQAVALVDEKAGRAPSGTTRRTVTPRAPRKAPEVALEAPKAAKPATRRIAAHAGWARRKALRNRGEAVNAADDGVENLAHPARARCGEGRALVGTSIGCGRRQDEIGDVAHGGRKVIRCRAQARHCVEVAGSAGRPTQARRANGGAKDQAPINSVSEV